MNNEKDSRASTITVSDKKRVLIVLRRLGMGGIEQASMTLASAIAKEGHEVHMLALKGTPIYSPEPPVKLHCRDLEKEQRSSISGQLWNLLTRLVLKPLFPDSGFVWQGISCSKAFAPFVEGLETQHGRFDLILIRGQGAFELLWKVQDDRVWRVVEAVTGHFKGYLASWLTRCLYQNHQVICVSQGVQDKLLKNLQRHNVLISKSKVIYNAVPLEKIKALAEEPHSPSFETAYLVHVARLVPIKQQKLLLNAYYLARQQGLDLPLVIIGDGSERRSLEALARRLAITEWVHFLGQQTNPFPWVAKATAFVLSSRSEGLGLVLIEALALGTQCVATDVPGGIREVLTDEQSRLLAEPSAESLAAKIIEAVNNPIKIDSAWTERFSEPRISHEYLDLIPPHNRY